MGLCLCEKNNIVAGIVLYNPELVRLRDNIEHIITQVDKVILFDNGSQNTCEIEITIQKFGDSIVLLKNDMNMGVAYALNRLCEWSVGNGYQYILTLDQDSVCPPGVVNVLKKNMGLNVAVSAPNIIYRNNETYAIHKSGAEEAEWVITSASLTSLEAWGKVGGFDEVLFIDGVDRDFCMRVRKYGYHIIKNYEVELMHELGNLKCRKVLGRTIYVTNHSALRKYYMVRNVIYLDKKHGEKRCLSCVTKNLLKTIFFEDMKMVKLKAIYDGVKDGIKM